MDTDVDGSTKEQKIPEGGLRALFTVPVCVKLGTSSTGHYDR